MDRTRPGWLSDRSLGLAEPEHSRGNLAELLEHPNFYELGVVTCIESGSVDTTTIGYEDAVLPDPGQTFFYVIEYDGPFPGSFGTESAAKPRVPRLVVCQ